MTTTELMAPAGSYESLHAAINAGADSVYFGIQQLNMRARSSANFTLDDLKKITDICKEANVKTYLTVNTLLYDHDLQLMHSIIDTAKTQGVDAVIVSDFAAILYAKKVNMPMHLSTQLSISNIEAVKHFSQYADTIVLARELTLPLIKNIYDEIIKQNICGPNGELIKIECFAHGALCVAVSGRCHMSLYTDNASANRGACVQNCRKAYKIVDPETNQELIVDNNYVMSPEDICTIDFLDKFIESGVRVLKLEGRGRSADYVHTVVHAYKQALELVEQHNFSKETIQPLKESLSKVYNKGLSSGNYLGVELHKWAGVYGNKSAYEKTKLGKVLNYYDKAKTAFVTLETDVLHKDEEIIIIGDTTGVITSIATEIRLDNGDVVMEAKKGDTVTIPCAQKVRKNDRLYVRRKRKPSTQQIPK